jgi:hypothetical protein
VSWPVFLGKLVLFEGNAVRLSLIERENEFSASGGLDVLFEPYFEL